MRDVIIIGSLEKHGYTTDLVPRCKNPRTFGHRCIPPRGVARRSNTPGMLPPRALRDGRIGALDVTRISATKHECPESEIR